MVRQDFAMACGLYPQDEKPFAETIRRGDSRGAQAS